MQTNSPMTVIWILIFFSGVLSWVIVDRKNYAFVRQRMTVWAIFWAAISAGLVILFIILRSFFGGNASNPFVPPPTPTATPTPKYIFGK